MLNKNTIKSIFIFSITAAIIFTGCNKETPLPDDSEITAAEMTSEIFSETVSDSPVTEAQTTEPETVTGSKSYEPYQIKLYDSKGTGMPRPDDYGEDLSYYYFGGDLNEIIPLMKNKEAAGKIRREAKALLDYANENYCLYGNGGDAFSQGKISTNCTGRNRFLFYSVYYSGIQMAHCAVFDMETGDRLELSDLFFEDEDFLTLLNKKIGEEIQKLIWEDYENDIFEYMPMKREFAGLTEDGFYFNNNSFYFPVSNPYFAKHENISIALYDFDTVLNVPYDMTSLFIDGADKTLYIQKNTSSVSSVRSSHSKTLHTGNVNIHLFDGSMYLTAEQEDFLNSQALNMTGEILDRLKRENNWTAYTDDEEPIYHIYTSPDGTVYKKQDLFEIYISIINNNFTEIHFYQSNVFDAPGLDYNLHFDLKTLEPINTRQIFERTFGDNEYVWNYVYVYQIDGDMLGNEITDMDGFISEKNPDINKLKPEDINIIEPYIYYSGNIDDHLIWGSISTKSSAGN